jgi:hypothetical protein
MVVKKPGLEMDTEMSELDLSYGERYADVNIPDAYERLILDCIRCGVCVRGRCRVVQCIRAGVVEVACLWRVSTVACLVHRVRRYALHDAAACTYTHNPTHTPTHMRTTHSNNRGDQQHFVRRDELRAAWAIFTPLLHAIDAGEITPEAYPYGSRGPPSQEAFLAASGYRRSVRYVWRPSHSTDMMPGGGGGGGDGTAAVGGSGGGDAGGNGKGGGGQPTPNL